MLLNSSDRIWSNFISFDPFQSSLVHFDVIWSISKNCVSLKAALNHNKQKIPTTYIETENDTKTLKANIPTELANGIDKSVVKASGKPLSIGLEDRFKCISTQSECREKAKWLLSRLAKLVLEDGRKPSTLKVFIRDYEKDKHDPKRKFAKYSR